MGLEYMPASRKKAVSNKKQASNDSEKGKSSSDLSNQRKELLKIYYQQKDSCDHLWLEGSMEYTDGPEEQFKLTQLYESLNQFSKSEKVALIVHIDSGGGDSSAGEMLHNLIRRFPKPTIGVVEGWCMSAATYVFLACDLRIFKPYTLFLIHQTRGFGGEIVKFKALRRKTYEAQLMYEVRVEIYRKRTKMPVEVIKNYLRSEKFMETKDALKYQVVHHIFDQKKIKPLKFKENEGVVREIMMSSFVNIIKVLTSPDFLQQKQVKRIIVYPNYEYMAYIPNLNYINLMLEIPIPIDFMVTSSINNGQVLMSLFANKTYLLKSMSLILLYADNFLMGGDTISGSIEDQVERTKINRDQIKKIFEQKTKLPEKVLDDLFFKSFSFKPEEALKYGLVDEIIDLDPEIKEWRKEHDE